MPSSFDLILKNGKCFIDGQLKTTDIGISDGIIKNISNIQVSSSQKILDASNLIVLPGIIDTQVHFREPGSTDTEDLETGSKSAVLGGVTSVFEMPNTNPPTSRSGWSSLARASSSRNWWGPGCLGSPRRCWLC